MLLVQLVIFAFILLESSNVLAMYFKPEMQLANAVGAFKAYEDSKQYPDIHIFINYLVNWVAGTKLIFLSLLAVILFFGDKTILTYTLLALVLSISSFFWRLFPLIRTMDKQSLIDPKGYSTTLFLMILVFVIIFLIVFGISLF